MQYRKRILILLLVLSGLMVMMYPSSRRLVTQLISRDVLSDLRKQLETTDMEMQKQLALEYNRKIRQQEAVAAEEYEKALNITDGVMGVLFIPTIGVELPIYHGVSDDVLGKGAGHLPGSALPIGGGGNHTVLTGHTGLPGAELFTNLTKLEVGDGFSMEVLGETLFYRIDQIKVVLPDEGEALAPVPGKDYCTLVTCTPYGINSHRLLVRGIRYKPEPPDLKNGKSTLPWLGRVLSVIGENQRNSSATTVSS